MRQELRQLRAEVKSLKGRKDPMRGDLTMVQNLNKQLQTKLGELEHENVNLRMALQVNKLQQVQGFYWLLIVTFPDLRVCVGGGVLGLEIKTSRTGIEQSVECLSVAR